VSASLVPVMLPHVHVRESLCLVYAGIGLKSALSSGLQKGFAILISSQIAVDVQSFGRGSCREILPQAMLSCSLQLSTLWHM